MLGDDSTPVDTGVGEDVVTVTAPPTLNWPLIALVVLAAWWVFNNLSSDTHED
jgi:hypothetical protein